MSDELSRVVDWMDDVLGWLREPMTAMPVDRVLERLRGAFQVNVTSWSSMEGLLMTGMILNPTDAMAIHAATMEEFRAGLHRDCHPLTAWYDRTPSTDPQTSDRVPYGLVPAARRSILVAPLQRLGLEQQMTISTVARSPAAASSSLRATASTSTTTTCWSPATSSDRWSRWTGRPVRCGDGSRRRTIPARTWA